MKIAIPTALNIVTRGDNLSANTTPRAFHISEEAFPKAPAFAINKYRIKIFKSSLFDNFGSVAQWQ